MEESFFNQLLYELSDYFETVVKASGEIHIGFSNSCTLSGGHNFGFRLHHFPSVRISEARVVFQAVLGSGLIY